MDQNARKKGIGWGGKTLKEMLAEKEQLYRETGCYYGLRELPLMKEDPLKLEVFFLRLLAATVAGRETTRMISASPMTRECPELAIALYAPEGDCILQSTGILIHIPLIGRVIEWMIRHNYEEEVGIDEGDIFTSNDHIIAGMHPPDVYDIIPIFHGGELLGWIGTVIHEVEIGAVGSGNTPTSATERFADGMRFSAEKTGTNDVYFKWFDTRVRHGCRLPDMFLLDRKGALAADIKVREEIKKIIGEFGADYYKWGVREAIEMERRAQMERVKMRTVPGRLQGESVYENYYSRVTMAPPQHRVDQITLVPIELMIKSDGKYFWDFDGAGAWGWHPYNTTPAALTGAACLLLTQQIAYTGTANTGTMLCVEMNTPFDTYVNPSSPNISGVGLFSVPMQGGAVLWELQSRAFFARGFLEEVMAGAVSASGTLFVSPSHLGQGFSLGVLGESAGGVYGSGGCAIRDGFTGFAVWQSVTDMGSVEVWELLVPMNYMGRRLVPDGCGWGKYRSGYPVVTTLMLYKTPQMAVETQSFSREEKIRPNLGMFGGYPGSPAVRKLVTNANTAELIQQRKPLVHGVGYPEEATLERDIKGKVEVCAKSSVWFEGIGKHGDWMQVIWGGAPGGFGDPIKRDPALVKKDLDNQLLSIERCRRIYCVEARYDEKTEEWVIDDERTAELRQDRRRERLSNGIPAKQWWQKRRDDLISANLPHLLKDMYNSSLAKGKRWPGEFRAFWNLPSDFTFR